MKTQKTMEIKKVNGDLEEETNEDNQQGDDVGESGVS